MNTPSSSFERFEDQLSRLQDRIGLKWKTTWVKKPGEKTCRILSDQTSKTHEIWILPEVQFQLNEYLPDVCHELCHGKISETHDQIFSTMRFQRRYGDILDGKNHHKKMQFQNRARMLEWSQSHVDLWVNQLRHQYWPELTRREYEDVVRFGTELSVQRPEVLCQPEMILSLAMQLADAERYQFDRPPLQQILVRLPDEVRLKIEALDAYYQTLPDLPSDRGSALKVFESSVQAVAQILNLSIQPSLVEEEGIMVWQLTPAPEIRKEKKKKKKR